MSITVADCMRLPALRDAKVLAGRTGLNQEISTVSVLEYARVFAMAEQLFLGNELILTAFTSVMDDVEAQCTAIRRLHEVGEAGLILYYVGYYVKSIDKRLIQTADELGFPLICMPSDYHSRYSEVITEVLELIIEDRKKETRFVPSILNQISNLRERQRSTTNILRMLSDRIRYSLLLLDVDGKECGLATWPMAENEDFIDFVRDTIDHSVSYPLIISWQEKSFCIHRYTFNTEVQRNLKLYIIGEGTSLDKDSCIQATEVLQTSYNIWSKSMRKETAGDLVRALLSGQRNEIDRIANGLFIDLSKIRLMWVIRLNSPEMGSDIQEILSQIKDHLRTFLTSHKKTAIVETFDNGIVAFMEQAKSIDLDQELCSEFLQQPDPLLSQARLIWCGALDSIQEVRKGYISVEEYFVTACKVYPHKRIFTLREIAFAQNCHAAVRDEAGNIKGTLGILAPLNGMKDEKDMLDTLAVYLIDADKNAAQAAPIMHVHESTIKYRLNKIEQRLGFDVSQMPGAYQLYLALAIRRLVES